MNKGPIDKCAAVLLAAGAGSRYAGPGHKLLAELPPSHRRAAETVAERAIAAVVESGIEPIIVITGAVDITTLIDRIDGHDHPDEPDDLIQRVANPRWAEGQMTSLQAGIDHARRLGVGRIVVGLADQPGVTSDAWRAVSDAGARSPIAVAIYDGRRGNPVTLRSDVWDLLPEDGDEGARSLMRIRPDLVVEVPCSGSSDDIDTVEDLRRWQNNSSTNSP